MKEPRMLSNMYELTESGFGRPWPRHGLKLLHWFANDCVTSNGMMLLECDPRDKDFGFHLFENRYERNRGKLLPDVRLTYYEVGNLHKGRARDLPDYVREDDTGNADKSNTDRLIVSVDDRRLGDVYVTEHDGQSNFNSKATFRISEALLRSIKGLTLDDFLQKVRYQGKPGAIKPLPQVPASKPTSMPPASMKDTALDMEMVSQMNSNHRIVEIPYVEENRCSCTIL